MAIRTRNGKLLKVGGKAVKSKGLSAKRKAVATTSSKTVGDSHPNAGKSKAATKYTRPIKDVNGTHRTAKPKVLKDGSKVGPAGERHGSSKTSTSLKGSIKNILKFGKSALNPLLIALQSEKLGGGTDMIDPKNPPKLYSGFKAAEVAKKVAPAKKKKKEEPAKKKAATPTTSFGAAFKAAKKAGESKFKWNGKSYSTATKDDVKKSKSKDLRQHLNKAEGKKPTSFGDAFKAAKKAGKATFNFKGKVYSTKTK